MKLKNEEIENQDERRKIEEESSSEHILREESLEETEISNSIDFGLYAWDDYYSLHMADLPDPPDFQKTKTIDDILKRDKQRVKDGFPKKVKVGKIFKPSKKGNDKYVIVPDIHEEKFYLGRNPKNQDNAGSGQGEGEVGDVVGEYDPKKQQQQGQGGQPGDQNANGDHTIETSAKEIGRILTERFQLPNLKDKGKKKSLTTFKYDLTDQNRERGQILDVYRSLEQIIKTNLALGNLELGDNVDTSKLIVSPDDYIYRILSKERDYDSQAIVFFVRDYSGSMDDYLTKLVVNQHLLIYAWLKYQYNDNVETRFILHDTKAFETDTFHKYYNLTTGGGTKVFAAYNLINKIVEEHNLAKDYNIYIFHGTDGDDWDTRGETVIPELKKMMSYANRIGITIVKHPNGYRRKSEMESYIAKANLLEQKELLKMVILKNEEDEAVIESLKELLS